MIGAIFRSGWLLLALTAAAHAQAPGSSAAPTAEPAGVAKLLLDQANFWHSQNQPEAAEQAVERLLQLEPDNSDALALKAQLQAERGERGGAQSTLSRLKALSPENPRINTLEQSIETGAIDPAGLAEARRLAKEGRQAEAVVRYQSLFRGGPPPNSIAAEYFQTLAGTEGGWEAARNGLERLAASNPNDARAQLAYAQLLTYREATRLQGIQRLSDLAKNSTAGSAAAKAWRQAVEWLPIDATSIAAYQEWLGSHPDDADVSARLQQARNPPVSPSDAAAIKRSNGFAALERGRLAEAETAFQAVIEANPQDADALGGLGLVRLRQGRSGDARDLLSRAIAADPAHKSRWEQALAGAKNRPGGQTAAQVRVEALRQRAAATRDPTAKEALLRAAVAADPGSPWPRLELARALLAQGRKAEARALMAEVTAGANVSVDALKAGALFAAEDGRSDDAAALIARLPAGARTEDMRALLAQGKLQTEIRSATGLLAISPVAGQEKLLTLAAQPDPDGARGVAIARAFLEMGNPAGARQALATAQAATGTPTVAQRIAYAGILLQAGDERGALTLISSLDAATGLTAQQAADLDRLRAGAAIRRADALNAQGRQAEAYDVLAPALARAPDDPDLNMAVARLYAAAAEPRKALAMNQMLLMRDPDNLDARRALLDTAVQLRDWALGERLVQEGMQLAPEDPRVWLMSASLNRANGRYAAALQDLRRAEALRQQQLGTDRLRPSPFGAAGPAASTAQNGATYQLATLGDPLVPLSGNPFRRGDGAQSLSDFPDALVPPPKRDPMLQNIDLQITTLEQQIAPQLTLEPSFRSRTGTDGLDRLNDVGMPMTLSLHPFERGTLTLRATPTFLSAGDVPFASQERFGTLALGGSPAPGSQNAEGIGFSLGYQIGWVNADIGITPLGFPERNIVGGLELSPQLTDNVRLRVVGERRAVTDSVLSYAGTEDPRTGTMWGGVTRTRGHAQVEISAQPANFYAGGGFAKLDGTNVASNSEYELGAGGSYPLWRNDTAELKVGLDLVYFAYDKNLRFFSLGQGGYFSPQSYFAAIVPVHYTSKGETTTWSIGGSVGYQNYHENPSPLYPNDPALQSQALLTVPTTSTIAPVYAGRTQSGLVGGFDGSLDYKVGDALHIGGRASYQHAGDWSEVNAIFFGKYIFDGRWP